MCKSLERSDLMERLFENTYVRDIEWAKDIYSYLYFRRLIMIVINILMLLYLFAGIYNSVAESFADWYFILVPIIWFPVVVFAYRKNVKTAINRDLELHGQPIEVTVIVTEDVIKQSQSTGSEFQLNYRDIKKAVQTKKYIYLLSKTSTIYSFKKSAFSIGCLNDFLTFLKSKGIKV